MITFKIAYLEDEKAQREYVLRLGQHMEMIVVRKGVKKAVSMIFDACF